MLEILSKVTHIFDLGKHRRLLFAGFFAYSAHYAATGWSWMNPDLSYVMSRYIPG